MEKQLTELKEKISSSDKQELEDKMQKLRSEMATPEADVRMPAGTAISELVLPGP